MGRADFLDSCRMTSVRLKLRNPEVINPAPCQPKMKNYLFSLKMATLYCVANYRKLQVRALTPLQS